MKYKWNDILGEYPRVSRFIEGLILGIVIAFIVLMYIGDWRFVPLLVIMSPIVFISTVLGLFRVGVTVVLIVITKRKEFKLTERVVLKDYEKSTGFTCRSILNSILRVSYIRIVR